MASLSSPPHHRVHKLAILNTFPNDHALLPEHDVRSEAAPSSDFQLFPEDVATMSVSSVPPFATVPTKRRHLSQNPNKAHTRPREGRHRTTPPCPRASNLGQRLISLDPLPPILNPSPARVDLHSSAGHSITAKSRAKLASEGIGSGVTNASLAGHLDCNLYRSWTQVGTGLSDGEGDDEGLPSPPHAPRIRRLRTPDLAPMEARAFCDCCTTTGPRSPCELCRKRKAERNYDLFGVGTMFD